MSKGMAFRSQARSVSGPARKRRLCLGVRSRQLWTC